MSKLNRRIIFVALIIMALALVGCSGKSQELEETKFYMNTVMTVKFTGKQATMDKVFERIARVESLMSSKIEDSEISRVNDNAGIKPVKVSDETYFVLEKSLEYAKNSKGKYDPTIGPLLDVWDIMGDYENRDWIPADQDIENAKGLVNYKKLILMDNNEVFLEDKGMKIDLGSIAKGYAADVARDVLKEDKVEFGLINLGGDVYAYGEKTDKSPWRIGLQDPLEMTGSPLGIIKIKNKSVVTSGDYERFFEIDGERYHHILDIDKGKPSNNELMSATVISDESIDGDAISTSLFIMGVEDGLKYVESIKGVDAIFVTKDKKVITSSKDNWEFELNKDAEGYEVENR